jgi:esterase/lipase superfamily enzyme
MVSRVVAFSGIYDVHKFLNGYWDDNCYFNCPTAYIPNMPSTRWTA